MPPVGTGLGSSQAAVQGLRQAGCWGSPHPAPQLRGVCAHRGMFRKLKAAPCMLQKMLNKLPLAITFLFPIGAILIGPFPGTSMKEKAICTWDFSSGTGHMLTDSIFSPLPLLLLSFPLLSTRLLAHLPLPHPPWGSSECGLGSSRRGRGPKTLTGGDE